MSCNKINTLLYEFGSSIGLDNLEANEDGYCALLVDKDRTLHIKYDDETDTIRLFMELGVISEELNDKIHISMLDANVLWRGTGGSILGIDAETSTATIACKERMGTMYLSRFEKMIDEFITSADIWCIKIQGLEIDDNMNSSINIHDTGSSYIH